MLCVFWMGWGLGDLRERTVSCDLDLIHLETACHLFHCHCLHCCWHWWKKTQQNYYNNGERDRAYKVKQHIIQNLQKRKSFSSKRLTFVYIFLIKYMYPVICIKIKFLVCNLVIVLFLKFMTLYMNKENEWKCFNDTICLHWTVFLI